MWVCKYNQTQSVTYFVCSGSLCRRRESDESLGDLSQFYRRLKDLILEMCLVKKKERLLNTFGLLSIAHYISIPCFTCSEFYIVQCNNTDSDTDKNSKCFRFLLLRGRTRSWGALHIQKGFCGRWSCSNHHYIMWESVTTGTMRGGQYDYKLCD